MYPMISIPSGRALKPDFIFVNIILAVHFEEIDLFN